jgi:hypothetical protein
MASYLLAVFVTAIERLLLFLFGMACGYAFVLWMIRRGNLRDDGYTWEQPKDVCHEEE